MDIIINGKSFRFVLLFRSVHSSNERTNERVQQEIKKTININIIESITFINTRITALLSTLYICILFIFYSLSFHSELQHFYVLDDFLQRTIEEFSILLGLHNLCEVLFDCLLIPLYAMFLIL